MACSVSTAKLCLHCLDMLTLPSPKPPQHTAKPRNLTATTHDSHESVSPPATWPPNFHTHGSHGHATPVPGVMPAPCALCRVPLAAPSLHTGMAQHTCAMCAPASPCVPMQTHMAQIHTGGGPAHNGNPTFPHVSSVCCLLIGLLSVWCLPVCSRLPVACCQAVRARTQACIKHSG